jgi:hypothetical protein
MLILAAFLIAAPLLGGAAYWLDRAYGKPMRIKVLERYWPSTPD